jgi:radical SAM protein with 4Fe4S-binding SPASM domain
MENKIQQLGLPNSFCFAPYTNLDLDQDGSFYPCYRSKVRQGKWKDGKVVEAYNNESMQELRDDLWHGRENDNCVQCHRRESEGQRSTRQQYNEDVLDNRIESTEFVEEIKDNHLVARVEDIHTMEVRPHGMCTNACAHCDENSSSRWISLQTLDNTPFLENYKDEPNVLDDLYNKATNLKAVHFTGGEPLLYEKTHLQHLQNIPNKETVELRYHSSLKTLPGDDIREMWKTFGHVKIFVSLDTSEKYFAYFRWGSNWPTTIENIEAIRDIVEIQATITVNVLTMLDIMPLINYLVDNDIGMNASFVDPPHQLSCVYLPNKLKARACGELNQARFKLQQYATPKHMRLATKWLAEIQEFMMSQDHGDSWPKDTVKMFRQLDHVYGLLIKNYDPELDFAVPVENYVETE